MTTASASAPAAFPEAQGREKGYDKAAVDAFLAKARTAFEVGGEAMTAADVRRAAFPLVRRGYAIASVDAALGRIEDAFAAREREAALSDRGGVRAWVGQTRETAQVVRNDAIDIEAVRRLAPKAVVLSPGPCSPREAGVSCAIVRELSGTTPILGICLGHQCIGEVLGGRVTRARHPMHGRASAVAHDSCGLFRGLPNPLRAGRYHSLIVELDEGVSAPIEVTASAASTAPELSAATLFDTEPVWM